MAQGPFHVVPGCAKKISTPFPAERELHRSLNRGLILTFI